MEKFTGHRKKILVTMVTFQKMICCLNIGAPHGLCLRHTPYETLPHPEQAAIWDEVGMPQFWCNDCLFIARPDWFSFRRRLQISIYISLLKIDAKMHLKNPPGSSFLYCMDAETPLNPTTPVMQGDLFFNLDLCRLNLLQMLRKTKIMSTDTKHSSLKWRKKKIQEAKSWWT